jgi:hypothetical protein
VIFFAFVVTARAGAPSVPMKAEILPAPQFKKGQHYEI